MRWSPIGSFYVYEWQNFSKDGLNLYKHQADGSFTTTPTSDDLVVKGQAEPCLLYTSQVEPTAESRVYDYNVVSVQMYKVLQCFR